MSDEETSQFKAGELVHKKLQHEGDGWNIYKIGIKVASEDDVYWISIFDSIGINKDGTPSKSLTLDKLEIGEIYNVGFKTKVAEQGDKEYINHTAFYIAIPNFMPEVSENKAVNGKADIVYDFPKITEEYLKSIPDEKRCLASYVGIGVNMYKKYVTEKFINKLKEAYNEIK